MSEQYNSVEAQASYGYGRQIGDQIKQAAFDGLDIEAMLSGIRDVMTGQATAVDESLIAAAFQQITARMEAKQAEQHKGNKDAGEQFLKTNAERPEVNVTETGLQYEVIAAGDGATPGATDKVRVHYHGTLVDGTVFDSSVQRGQPIEFPVNGVIKGWTEALQNMKVGDKWKLYIPQELAYGAQGAGAAIAPYSALIFEVELLGVM
ncbi:FKBP-type peptidyl-prolyl cis-trans isomerase [Celerinatantimonas sp. YJH-8]|uniref:FKBP-type peptidyl-prolyl cis-trans isomerase n=1 Tax=Celerinatantimonas sp. YJH-8 TaxID=3228714 RepID=UPI0038C2F25B